MSDEKVTIEKVDSSTEEAPMTKWARRGLLEPLPGESYPPPIGKKRHWIKCRAHNSCEGNHAWEEAHMGAKGAAVLTTGQFPAKRYRCTTCNGVWHIATGSGFTL